MMEEYIRGMVFAFGLSIILLLMGLLFRIEHVLNREGVE